MLSLLSFPFEEAEMHLREGGSVCGGGMGSESEAGGGEERRNNCKKC